MNKNSFKRLLGKRLFLSLSVLFLLLASGFWLFLGGSTEINPKKNHHFMLNTNNRDFKVRTVTHEKDGALNKEEIKAVGGIKILHSFAGSPADGAYPMSSLIVSGSTLFGMTGNGGVKDLGTIFKMQTDGTGFTLLHEFDGGVPQNTWIWDSLTIFGSTLYGMIYGTIFKIQVDGSNFSKIFTNCWEDYSYYKTRYECLIDTLIISGTTLYGMIHGSNGQDSYVAIIKLQTDGKGYSNLHQWPFGFIDEGCTGSLIISGSTLYGTILFPNYYTDTISSSIFKIQTDGSGFTLLHSFTGYFSHGDYHPDESLILSGSTIYGRTSFGGASKKGTIFRMQTDGSDFSLLHEFTGGAGDGSNPEGSLILCGSNLYGMTTKGGAFDAGTLFQIHTDGSGFALIDSFAGGTGDGAIPKGSLILSGSTLYGMTDKGGDHDVGMVFSLYEPNIASISVVSPNGGEKWTEGDTHNITWKSTGTLAKVNIDYSTNKGGSWSPVVTNTANDGNYIWTLPNTPSTKCLVRISDAANTSISDTSDSVFSILMNLDLVAERHEVRAFSILRQYGQINFLGGNPNIPVAEYRIMRRKGNEDFKLLRTVAPSELQDNQFQMQDKYLEKGISYTYRVEAFDAAGQLIGLSLEKMI